MKTKNTPKQSSNEDTITFKRRDFHATLTVLTFAAGVFLGCLIWGTGSTGSVQTAAIDTPTEEPGIVRYDIPIDGSPSIGPEDAPVVIVEFSDYQCPFCQKWHNEVYDSLLAAYPGKIKFVYRNLPLTSIHPDAFSAAEAALCAGDQNAYWEFHDKLFNGKTLGSKVYLQYAEELDLDIVSFESCITNHKYKDVVQADSEFAVDLGVRSTPTFFINGIAVVGAQPLHVFKELIDKEPARELPNN